MVQYIIYKDEKSNTFVLEFKNGESTTKINSSHDLMELLATVHELYESFEIKKCIGVLQ